MSELVCEEVREDDAPEREIDDETNFSLWGGFEPAPSWDEYVAEFGDSLAPQLEAARTWLMARGEPYPSASEWCNDHFLRFSDGITISFTWRAWGDFVQAVVGKREGYVTYY